MSDKQHNPVCSECKSRNIEFDAIAHWDSLTGTFEISGIMDKGHYCADCDCERSVQWSETRFYFKARFAERPRGAV